MPIAAGLAELLALLAAILGGAATPEQGLLIAGAFYEAIAGHPDGDAAPEADLLRRIGRRRLVMLPAGARFGRWRYLT